MHFNPDMRICLPRNSPRLHKIDRLILIQVVTSLGCAHSRHHLINVVHWPSYFLFPSNRVIVELPALLLQLVVTNVKRVSTKGVAHSHVVVGLARLAGVLMDTLRRLIIVLVIISPSRLILLVNVTVMFLPHVLVPLPINSVIGINIMRLLAFHSILKIHEILLFLLLRIFRRDENLLLGGWRLRLTSGSILLEIGHVRVSSLILLKGLEVVRLLLLQGTLLIIQLMVLVFASIRVLTTGSLNSGDLAHQLV